MSSTRTSPHEPAGRDHRRLFVLTGCAALATVAATVPLALSDEREPEVDAAGPSAPARRWATTAPDGFPLAEGLRSARAVLVPAAPELTSFFACDRISAWTTATTTSLIAVRSGHDVSTHDRVLALYPDDSAAATALARVPDAVRRCSAGGVVRGALPLVLDGGEASYAFVDTRRPRWSVTAVVRVGNALLIDRVRRSVSGPAGVGEMGSWDRDGIERVRRTSAGVVSAMCSFAAVPCPRGDRSPTASH